MVLDEDETLGLPEKPPPSPEKETPRSEAEDPNLGRRIGPYRIESLLGRGGMGVIYLAAREDDFEQQVALKLVRPGLRTAEVLDRFYKERQILGRLQHPSIAQIFDGGTTDDALPYFVMEYVEGRPVDRYNEEQKLPLKQRLELFREICSVVHFAHQNLVVHRDLKPGNILVTPEGTPKLLDFGIAKILHSEADAFDTQSDKRPMTPDYASPEQLLNGPITTASDVYSLGVLLYRLVAGRMPYRLEGYGPARMAEILCREDPLPPSVASGRPGLAGDVDAIVLKAMAKDPRDRYASALQLAEDVERHLADLPVRACEGSWIYRTRKLARRNKLGVAAAFTVLAFALVTSVLWRQAVDQREQAEASRLEAEASQLRAERVSGFLEVRRRLLGEDHVQVAITRKNLAALLLDLGETESAGELLEPALETLRRAKGEGDWTIADAESVWGNYLAARGRYSEAEPFLLSGYRTLQGVKGDQDVDTRDALQRVIDFYEAWGREEKVAEYREKSTWP